MIGDVNRIRVKGRAKYYNAKGKRIKKKDFILSPSVVYIERANDVYFDIN